MTSNVTPLYPELELILRAGNKPPLTLASMRDYKPGPNWLRCADGFLLSVIAGDGAYCSPRPSDYGLGTVPASYAGPYFEVEVGFPSARPEPWTDWAEWAERPDEPTDTVYGYVPAAAVRALVALHGGVVEAACDKPEATS